MNKAYERRIASEREAERAARDVSAARVAASARIASERRARYKAIASARRPLRLRGDALDDSEGAVYARIYEYERANGATANEANEVAASAARSYRSAKRASERC